MLDIAVFGLDVILMYSVIYFVGILIVFVVGIDHSISKKINHILDFMKN